MSSSNTETVEISLAERAVEIRRDLASGMSAAEIALREMESRYKAWPVGRNKRQAYQLGHQRSGYSRAMLALRFVLDVATSGDIALSRYVMRPAANREPYVRMLREALRVEVGPSIDDVREVWESPRATSVHDTDHGLSAQPWHVRVPHPEGGSMIFGGATEREALQAAYDAGVARAKAATVPPS